MINISPELIGSAVIGLITAGFWYWVKSIDKRNDEDRKTLNYIQREYVRRDDYKEDNARIYDLLKDIKRQLNQLDNKLDSKADKQR